MMCRRGKAGDNAPKLSFPFVTLLLGVFFAAVLPVGAFSWTRWFRRSGPKFSPLVALSEGDKEIPQRPRTLIIKVAEWRWSHKLFPKDLFHLEDSMDAVLHMTCHAYHIDFKGESRFEDTKKRVRACYDRAMAYLEKNGLSQPKDVVFEVDENHVDRLLKYGNAMQSGSAGVIPPILDTIDIATSGATTFFYYCQKTTHWDDKSSKCLGGMPMDYFPHLSAIYDKDEMPVYDNNAQPTGGVSNEGTQQTVKPESLRQSSSHTLVLLKPLNPITHDAPFQRDILFVNLMQDERRTWGSFFDTRKAAGGGRNFIVACNTDIELGWLSQYRKDKTGTLKAFSGIDLSHLESCLNQVPLEVLRGATDAYIASSQSGTLQAFAHRQARERQRHREFKLILKMAAADPALNVNLDPALWETYKAVETRSWDVKIIRATGAEILFCSGHPAIDFSAAYWELRFNVSENFDIWDQWESPSSLDLRRHFPMIYSLDPPMTSDMLEGVTKFTFRRKTSGKKQDTEDVEFSSVFEVSEICPTVIHIPNLDEEITIEITCNETKYDIRATAAQLE